MPRYLKVIYLGAAALAILAFGLGLYEYVIIGDQDAHLGSDVFLPVAVLVIVVALYSRRKREMESRSTRSRSRERNKR